MELARACAVEVDPASLLRLAQARTAFGGGPQAFQVLRIAFLVCGLHLPSFPSLIALALLLLLESLSLCPKTSSRRKVASSLQEPRLEETIVLYLLGSALFKGGRATVQHLQLASGANLARHQSSSVCGNSSIQRPPSRPFDRPALLSTRRDTCLVAGTSPCERSRIGDFTISRHRVASSQARTSLPTLEYETSP